MSHYTICLHPWAVVEDVQTYAENESDAIGWCVYVREDTAQGGIEIDYEEDFPSYAAALEYATTLAAKYSADIFEY
jgi:hypothetical protein